MQIEIIHGKTGFIKTAYALIPTYQISENNLLLFDSGEEPSTELLDMLDARVRAVLCTHLHFDHIANNEALIARYGTEIFAHPAEISSPHKPQELQYPIPPIDGTTCLKIDGVPIPVMYTPGHSFGHLAYVTPDHVCCLGDAIIRKELDLYAMMLQCITKPTTIKDAATDFMVAIGIRPQMMEEAFLHHTIRIRLEALAKAGEFSIEDDLIVPKNTGHDQHC